jgi:hypothetical protein
MHHHREKSISGIIGDRLGYGKFGEWIKLEFEWSYQQANRLMVIASELGDRNYGSDLPQGMKPAYALASAMSKEDEDGRSPIIPDSGIFTSSGKKLFSDTLAIAVVRD